MTEGDKQTVAAGLLAITVIAIFVMIVAAAITGLRPVEQHQNNQLPQKVCYVLDSN